MIKAMPPPCTEGACVNVGLGESNRRSGCADDGSDGSLYIFSTDLLPLVALLDTSNRRRAGGAVALKVCHSAMHGRHWTPLGVGGSAVSDRLSLDSVLPCREEETDELCLCEDVVGCRRGVVGLLPNEELDDPESERVVGSISAAFAVLSGPEEEEEGDPGEVADGNVSWDGSLDRGVQGLDHINREGPHSCWRRIFLLIRLQLVNAL